MPDSDLCHNSQKGGLAIVGCERHSQSCLAGPFRCLGIPTVLWRRKRCFCTADGGFTFRPQESAIAQVGGIVTLAYHRSLGGIVTAPYCRTKRMSGSMNRTGKSRSRLLLVLAAVGAVAMTAAGLLIVASEDTISADDIMAESFAALQEIRLEKEQEVQELLNQLKAVAYGVATDSRMMEYFDILLRNGGGIGTSLQTEMDEHFLTAYDNFYDVLFVDSTGLVFHSMKHESDFRSNLLKGRLGDTRLARQLRSTAQRGFVEYDFYPPSDEPAAFFVVSVEDRLARRGWIVLQCPVNQLNVILTGGTLLGRTGEVYLVSEDKLMLTDSRFSGTSTILTLEVDTKAVNRALRGESGSAVIEDYRGERVLSTYEMLEFLGAKWVLIAEMDEDEIVTEHYRDHKRYFRGAITSLLRETPTVLDSTDGYTDGYRESGHRVDIREFAKGASGSQLYTLGLSTCTGAVMVMPQRFAYLAHIPPTDAAYSSEKFDWLMFRDERRNLLNTVLSRAAYYDVSPFELREIQFYLVASHDRSFTNAVDEILDSGVELSNIHFIYNPEAQNANIVVDANGPRMDVVWTVNGAEFTQHGTEADDLGTIVETIAGFGN